MSSNIGPVAIAKYQEYLNAKDIDERIKKLGEFISAIPKHKSSEKIVALNKSRLAKLRKEKEDIFKRKQAQSASASAEDPFSIKREPDTIQVTLVSDFFKKELGSGKSTLVKKLTGLSDIQIGQRTMVPKIGIYEDANNLIKLQLIEMPALREWQNLSRVM